MTKEAALQAFFEELGLDTYAATAVPDDVALPYLTYEPIFGTWENGEVGITVNMWFYTSTEALPNTYARELSDLIGYGGTIRECDGGALWVKRGSPWCQSLQDDTNKNVKRRYINVSVEYLTGD